MLFFLLSDVEKKRKHTLNKHRSPPFIPVEGALRMLQTHATPRTLPFVFFGIIGADRQPKQAMPVARQEDLGYVCPLVALSVATVRSTL